MEREPNTIYVASISYGKDSLAMLEAIKRLNYPLDRIIHAEVWFNDTIHADLPPMIEFKANADKIIYERYGIQVERVCDMRNGEKLTYEKMFYHIPNRRTNKSGKGRNTNAPQENKGFPLTVGSYCKKLKDGATKRAFWGFPISVNRGDWCKQLKTKTNKFLGSTLYGAKINTVQYMGIALDEPIRIERHKKNGVILPLVDIGWKESDCRKWCEENDLLSPIYTTATRGGCWFCHNQGVEQLRLLRKNYPDLWGHLLRLDNDSPTTFKADGHTVHDFDKRFEMEDKGIIKVDEPFFWKYLENPPTRQLNIFDLIGEE